MKVSTTARCRRSFPLRSSRTRRSIGNTAITSAEDLLKIINVLGDATTEELRERCDEKLEEYLRQLQEQGRITNFNFPSNGKKTPRWVTVEKKAFYDEIL